MTLRNALVVGTALVVLSGCATNCNDPYPHPASRCYAQQEEARLAAKRASEQAMQSLRAQCNPSLPPPAKEWTSASKPGDGSVFAFRGNIIGDPIERQFPCYQRTDLSTKVNNCAPSNEIPGLHSCSDLSGKSPDDVLGRNLLGDIPVEVFSYEYIDGRLANFQIWVSDNSFEALRRLLEAKYGKPTNLEVGSVQNRMGASFDRITESWATPSGKMVLQSRWGSIDTARLWFENPEAERVKGERRKAVAKDKVKGAL